MNTKEVSRRMNVITHAKFRKIGACTIRVKKNVHVQSNLNCRTITTSLSLTIRSMEEKVISGKCLNTDVIWAIIPQIDCITLVITLGLTMESTIAVVPWRVFSTRWKRDWTSTSPSSGAWVFTISFMNFLSSKEASRLAHMLWSGFPRRWLMKLSILNLRERERECVCVCVSRVELMFIKSKEGKEEDAVVWCGEN